MGTRLDQLLEEIGPSRSIDPTARRVDDALNTFTVGNVHINDWRIAKALMARLYVHIQCTVLDIHPELAVDIEADWGRCCQHLKRVYGSESHYVAMHRIMTTMDGGLRGVINDLAACMAEEYARNEIAARIQRWWQHLTPGERLDAPKEYLANYGHLLPQSVREDGAPRVRAFFTQHLEEYPFALKKLRGSRRAM